MASNNQGGNKGGKQGGNQQSGDTSNRGFASMDPQRQREIASEGGRAAHASGNAHEFTSEEARRAGSLSHGGGGGGNQQSGGQGGGQGGGGNQASSGGNTRGGSPEQHAKAGSQSHKNDKR
ncbi:KGG domain-containing protein [Massilia sp. IC2-477]|uniref:KGG domain-containing protein n=1 Tax=Massilia sp. IC2-477 TaxID=2887198 RepID=UPI001D11FC22|nr:KGG domain-containing protein [Massilia sp. IC2-477]MCC2955895.1 KGG domain-containing protein [Massilia sp. IC2-477]